MYHVDTRVRALEAEGPTSLKTWVVCLEQQEAKCGNECEIGKMISKSGRRWFMQGLYARMEAKAEDNDLGEGANSGNGKKFSDSG